MQILSHQIAAGGLRQAGDRCVSMRWRMQCLGLLACWEWAMTCHRGFQSAHKRRLGPVQACSRAVCLRCHSSTAAQVQSPRP